MPYYKNGFLMRRWGQFCALCERCGKRIRKGENYVKTEWADPSRYSPRLDLARYEHVHPCPTTKKEEQPMPAEHYYLVINAEGMSEIVKKEVPEKAARYAYNLDEESHSKVWHLSKGHADHHYLAYEFHFNGPMTGRRAHVVDLGPVTAYDSPGLPRERMTGGCGKLRDCDNCSIAEDLVIAEDLLSICERKDDPCADCYRGDGHDALVKHHLSHHQAEEAVSTQTTTEPLDEHDVPLSDVAPQHHHAHAHSNPRRQHAHNHGHPHHEPCLGPEEKKR